MTRLFDDLADLDDAGGAGAAAEAGPWPATKVNAAIRKMELVRRMLRDEVARLRDERRGSG